MPGRLNRRGGFDLFELTLNYVRFIESHDYKLSWTEIFLPIILGTVIVVKVKWKHNCQFILYFVGGKGYFRDS